ncbi:2-amino-4-hydroxy-6-hydroxymethyldihydropteridine diphosphokinase [Planktotalea sp.]|uniref:2-amino-4-hydroxy-6- hydroxymethyldihydropteridine diphosphokinase n=1 Tax=Planktotalea sp. TaxID=2029877 RepID=UPI003296C564
MSLAKSGALQLVALGANLSSEGDSLEVTVQAAIRALAEAGFAIRAVSRFFRTPCFPAGAGPDYVNAAVTLQSSMEPDAILQKLHSIEADFGRERVQRWGQRTLDLDLIGSGDLVLPSLSEFERWFRLDPSLQAQAAPDALVLPHPRLQDRAFVLAPLADIAADWVHPVLKKSVRQMLAELPKGEIDQVVPI